MVHETQSELEEVITAITLVYADRLQESTLQHVHSPTQQAQSRTVESGPHSN